MHDGVTGRSEVTRRSSVARRFVTTRKLNPGDRVAVLSPSDGAPAAFPQVHERGLEPVAVLVRRSTLEDVFLHLTGRSLVD